MLGILSSSFRIASRTDLQPPSDDYYQNKRRLIHQEEKDRASRRRQYNQAFLRSFW